MKQKLILIGAGGHCKSCIDVIESTELYEILGILDLPHLVGTSICGYPIIGTDADIPKFIKKGVVFLITVGQITHATLRTELYNKVHKAHGSCATIIAKTAHVSRTAHIGTNTIIMHQVVVNADAKIGSSCIVNTFANIEHDVTIGDFCHISTGAMVNGGCTIGDASFIGSQSMIAQSVTIPSHTTIGAGSVVLQSISEPGVFVGNPLKKIR